MKKLKCVGRKSSEASVPYPNSSNVNLLQTLMDFQWNSCNHISRVQKELCINLLEGAAGRSMHQRRRGRAEERGT